MKPLRTWQARKAWRARIAEPVRRPSRPLHRRKQARLLLLVNQDDAGALSAARAFAKTYRNAGAEVKELALTSVKAKADERDDARWTPADLGFNGLPKPEAEEFWRKQEFDFVIHCALQPCEPLDYLAAGLCAHRRVAAYDTALEAYDLVVNAGAGEGVAAFLRQVDNYLDVLSV